MINFIPCTRPPALSRTRAARHRRAPRAGNYSQFLEQRSQREAQERATAEAQQAEIARLEGFVTRFGAKCAPACGAARARTPARAAAGRRPAVAACARGGAGHASWRGRARRASKASQAQSRQKQLEKLREAAVPLPAAASGAGPGDARKVRPRPPAPRAAPRARPRRRRRACPGRAQVALRLPKAPPCDEVILQLEVGS
jgi:ATPase subunit of ABC transporter with duplicated ATPase domains